MAATAAAATGATKLEADARAQAAALHARWRALLRLSTTTESAPGAAAAAATWWEELEREYGGPGRQ
jgi:hypothetical protein